MTRMAIQVGYNVATGELYTPAKSFRPEPWAPVRAVYEAVERVRDVTGFGSFTGLYVARTADVEFHYLVQEGPEAC